MNTVRRMFMTLAASFLAAIAPPGCQVGGPNASPNNPPPQQTNTPEAPPPPSAPGKSTANTNLPTRRAPDPPAASPGKSTPRNTTTILTQGPLIYWAATTDEYERKYRQAPDWAAEIDFGSVPVRNDFVFLYEQWFMEDVRTKGLGYTRSPEFDRAYSETLRRAFDQHIPDLAFDGIICFDVESIPLLWSDRTGGPGLSPKTDHGPKQPDLWFDWLRTNEPGLFAGRSIAEQERVLKRTYDGAVRLWLQRTFDEARRLRPRAKFAMYGIPAGSRYGHYAWKEPNRWKAMNDEMRWLVDLQDVTVLVLYQNRKVLPKGEKSPGLPIISYDDGVAYITDNVAEARRIAPHKPLLALISLFYPDSKGAIDGWLDAPALEVSIAETKKAGADGLVIWHHFKTPTSKADFQNALNAGPLRLLHEHWSPPR